VENASGLGRHLAVRLAAAGECVVDVPPKLSARVRVLSSFAGNARNNDGLDALATALAASRNERLAAVDPQAASEVLRLLSERREDLVAERTRALNRLHAFLRDLLPAGWPGSSRPTGPYAAQDARHTAQGCLGPPQTSVGLGGTALRVRTLDTKIADLNGRIEAEIEAPGTTLAQIFGIGPVLAARIIGTVGDVERFPSKAHFASYAATAPVETSSGEVVRHRLSLAGNRKLNRAPCTWSRYAKPDRTPWVVPTTARRRWRRASPARKRCGASRGASQMPSSEAFWRIRRHPRAVPLDKEEPRSAANALLGAPKLACWHHTPSAVSASNKEARTDEHLSYQDPLGHRRL
jgi:transposase